MNEPDTNELSSRRRWMRDVAFGGMAAAATRSCLAGSSIAAEPDHRLELKSGKLAATIVDNHDGLSGQQQIERRARMPVAADGGEAVFCTVPFEERFGGYNGVARLRHDDSPSPFLPCAAGHNCEFFFDRAESTFEPRWRDGSPYLPQPSSLTRQSESAAVLKIEPGDRWSVAVQSRFQLVAPYYLDIEHSFTPTDTGKISGDVLGVFWATYLQVPREPGYYFVSQDERWTSVYAALQQRGPGVIAPRRGAVGERLELRESGRRLLYGVTTTRYRYPFYCGNVNGMLLALMFRPDEQVEIRFAYNSTGGGPGVPAWDFQALVADPEPGKRYSFTTRTVYKPFQGLDEALRLYRQWSA